MTKLDEIVRRSLTRFTESIFESNWFGKEREAVSLYAMGYLPDEAAPDSVLFDKRQIGIEVRVPKPSSRGKKSQVCKDLVIWREPAQTCWNEKLESVIYPLSVMEWKSGRTETTQYDLDWLTAFAKDAPGFIGYAVTLDLKRRKFRLKCDRVTKARLEKDWLVL